MRKKLGRNINLVHNEDPPPPDGRLFFEERFNATTDNKSRVLESLMTAMCDADVVVRDSTDGRARLCLDEALINAVMHGSQFDGAKSVHVQAYALPDGWSVRVEDEGTGFKDEDLPDPDAAENLLEESGRGVHLMRSMLTEVTYWRGGRTLVLTQRTPKKKTTIKVRRPTSKNRKTRPS